MIKIPYTPPVCSHCGQETEYVLAIDNGTAHIVKQIAKFIGRKGINAVHPRKEMEGTYLTSNQVGNLTRARIHGLIARVDGNPGNYLLTRKGSKFLHGEAIAKYAIVKKSISGARSHNEGYFMPDEHQVVISDFDPKNGEGFWEGVGYEIVEGEVIKPKS